MATFPPGGARWLGLALAVAACDAVPPSASTHGAQGALGGVCPAPVNDVPRDLEQRVPLLYGTRKLNLFNVFWGESWNTNPANFRRSDIDQALRDVVATPYFDSLCQYGVPGFQFEGSVGSVNLIQTCPKDPGPTVSSLSVLKFMSCEEYSTVFTGVPVSLGAPNPLCVGCSGLPLDCFDPTPLPPEPLCLLTPNPTADRVYVVLLPKGTTIDDFGQRSCDTYNAYHVQIPSRGLSMPFPPFVVPGTQGRPLNLAIIPTECFSNLADLVTAITHEVVEAATDPLPLANWIDESSASPGGILDFKNVGTLLTKGEAADLCYDLGFTQTPLTGTGGKALGVAPYWSNADNACVSLGDPQQPPPPAVDVTPPMTTGTQAPPQNARGWNSGPVTVELAAVDPVVPGAPTSGVQALAFSAAGAQPLAATVVQGATAQVPFSAEGVSTLTFHAVDRAGNVEADQTRTVRIDLTPPVVGLQRVGGPTYGVDENVIILCSFSDALSDISSFTPCGMNSPAWTLGLGSHTITASATDGAGNTGTGSISFSVEVTPTGLCGLARSFSTTPGPADRLCCLLDQLDAAHCCGARAELLEEVQEELCEERGQAFTDAQATTLDGLVQALAPPLTCQAHRGGDHEEREHRGQGHHRCAPRGEEHEHEREHHAWQQHGPRCEHEHHP